MKFGTLKANDYFEKGGDLYKKLSDGMHSKKALHIKSKTVIEIPFLEKIKRVNAPPPKLIRRPRPEPEPIQEEKNEDE